MKSNSKEFSEKNKQIIMNNHLHHHHQDNSQNTSNNNSERGINGGGWSFLQALSNTSQQTVPKEPIYVHPLVKRSSSALSEKSLKLCTENLGNETGTDMMMMMMMTTLVESDVVVVSEELSEDRCSKTVVGSDDYMEQSKVKKQRSSSQSLVAEEKAAKARNFPPPLTTIRDGDSLRVSPQRENGRLIIKAVKSPSKKSCFQADRSINGRLRLCLVENFDTRFDSESESDSIDYGEEIDGKEEDCENDSKIEEEEEVEVEVEYFGEEGKRDGEVEEVGMDGNCVKGGGEIGIVEKYGRPSCRCKEGSEQEKKKKKNKTVVLNWEPAVWVTS